MVKTELYRTSCVTHYFKHTSEIIDMIINHQLLPWLTHTVPNTWQRSTVAWSSQAPGTARLVQSRVRTQLTLVHWNTYSVPFTSANTETIDQTDLNTYYYTCLDKGHVSVCIKRTFFSLPVNVSVVHMWYMAVIVFLLLCLTLSKHLVTMLLNTVTQYSVLVICKYVTIHCAVLA